MMIKQTLYETNLRTFALKKTTRVLLYISKIYTHT